MNEVTVKIQVEYSMDKNAYMLQAYIGPFEKIITPELIKKILNEGATMIAADIKDRVIEEIAKNLDMAAISEMVVNEIVADAKRRILAAPLT